MQGETKTEIVVFSLLAGFLGVLWYVNRQNSAVVGDGFGLSPFGDNASAASASSTPSTLPLVPAVQGASLGGITNNQNTYNATPYNVPGISSCNTCAGSGGNNIQYANAGDMAQNMQIPASLSQILENDAAVSSLNKQRFLNDYFY